MSDVLAVKPKMVKVRVLAEQMSYTPSAGADSRRNYMRGDVLEMEEAHALSASAGTHPEASRKDQRHSARAAVEIIGSADEVAIPVSKSLPNPALDPAQIALDRENEEGRRKAKAEEGAEKARLAAEGVDGEGETESAF